jgi:hypothetical protein
VTNQPRLGLGAVLERAPNSTEKGDVGLGRTDIGGEGLPSRRPARGPAGDTETAESLARRRLVDEDRSAVADGVESALHLHDIDELNNRAGYHPGRGYVDPAEAADEILDEALQPFLDDLARRGELGMTAAAVEVAVGILCGLYACRNAGSESLLEYAPDYPIERAADVVGRCVKLRVELPVDDLLELMPEWRGLLRPTPSPQESRNAENDRHTPARVGSAPRTGRSKK